MGSAAIQLHVQWSRLKQSWCVNCIYCIECSICFVHGQHNDLARSELLPKPSQQLRVSKLHLWRKQCHQAVQMLGTLLMLFFIMHPVTALPVTLSAQAAVDKPPTTMPMAVTQCKSNDWLNSATSAFTHVLLTSGYTSSISSCTHAQQQFARHSLAQQVAHTWLLQCQLASLCYYSRYMGVLVHLQTCN